MFATVGILAARHRTLLTGVGELLDVSILESLILTQNMYSCRSTRSPADLIGEAAESICLLSSVPRTDGSVS
jgi:hypothetical protein